MSRCSFNSAFSFLSDINELFKLHIKNLTHGYLGKNSVSLHAPEWQLSSHRSGLFITYTHFVIPLLCSMGTFTIPAMLGRPCSGWLGTQVCR